MLKRTERRTRVVAAMGGIACGVGFSMLCFRLSAPKSRLEQLFDFRSFQVVVPVSIMVVFFWGLLICHFRRQRVRACEKIATTALALTAAEALARHGPASLSAQFENPNANSNPLLRRLKALLAQWQLKPGLIEADLVLQQFIADDEEATRRAYSLVRTFVWALPVLGLIGTVLGIAFAVGGFANFLGGRVDDVEAIKTSLVGVTGGLSFAFLLTLLGLVTSLALMLLASGLETREERLHQSIQQDVVTGFLPVLQHVSPAESNGLLKSDPTVNSLKQVGEAVLDHVANLAEKHAAKLSQLLAEQQQHVTAWGKGLHAEASSAAAVVKISLEDTAKSLRDSGSEFLARLDLIRQTWADQTRVLKEGLEKQTITNAAVAKELNTALERQAQATGAFAGTLERMQDALQTTGTSLKALEAGMTLLSQSSLRDTLTALAGSLATIGSQTQQVTANLEALTLSTRQTTETQAAVHAAVKQLHDLKLIETLASFREALTRHANLVDKLNTGLKITLG